MTTNLDTLLHVVEHAKRWQLKDDRFKKFVASSTEHAMVLPDGELALFAEWARHLGGDVRITGYAPNDRGWFHVSGKLLSGHDIDVSVEAPGQSMRDRGMTGDLALGEVEQFARKPVPA